MEPKRASAIQAFGTDEGFKAVASRLGMSPNTLRKWWVEEFGQEAFTERGKRIQAEGAVRSNQTRKGQARSVRQVVRPCSTCQAEVPLSAVQAGKLQRVLCPSCAEAEKGVDRHCPVCGLGCVGEKGLVSHLARPTTAVEEHAVYTREQEELQWEGLTEGRGYIRCLICGHRGIRIDRHLEAAHGLSTVAYRTRFPGAEVQAEALREARAESAVRQHQEAPRTGVLKEIPCPSCGQPWMAPLTFAPSIHTTRCPDCMEAVWDDLTEGRDYVVCQLCGYRAENLTSHLHFAHPTVEDYPYPIVALNSAVRDKSALRGRQLLAEVRAKMSANAGRWNAGLTKETDPRVARSSERMMGRGSWSKGHTKDTDNRLAKTAQSVAEIRSIQHWTNGNEVNLSLDQLLPFRLKNGKVSVGRAIAALGHAFVTIKRECHKHGLEVSHQNIQQALCMEILSQVLGGVSYEMEWSPSWALNPATGRSFRFDGYFPSHRLVAEFYGWQHWVFPSVHIQDEAQFFALQEHDRIKENLVHAHPELRYFLVREDEPYTDPDYLRGRLLDEGFLDP